MVRPLNVLLMAGSMDPGGSERQTLNLLNHLDRTRFAPHLYLSYRQGALLPQVPEDVPIIAFSDQDHSGQFRFPGRVHRQHVRHLRQAIIDRQIDLVYDRTFHMSLLADAAARRLRCPRMATIVCGPEDDVPASEVRFVRIKRWMLRRSYQHASVVLTVSDHVAQSAARYYNLPAERFTTLYSPVDVESIDRASQTLPADVPIESSDVNIACIGRMSAEKGQRHLIRAIDRLRSHDVFDCLKVWMLGDGPLFGALKLQTEQLGLGQQIHFLGQRDSAISILSQCQAICVPSMYEGLPNVVMEAMCLGVPVIASDIGACRELLQGDRWGSLCKPGDYESIADAITEFVESPETAEAKAHEARSHIRSQQNIKAVMPRIEQMMLDLRQQNA